MKKLLYFLMFTSLMNSQCFTKVSTAYQHNIALKPNGTLWGWGMGGDGELNNMTNFDEYEPIQLSPDTNWSSLFCGRQRTFAIKSNGTLWACGMNYNGNLGIGSTAPGSDLLVQVGAGTNWKSISAGVIQSVGLKTNGTVWSWGPNENGQTGTGLANCCNDVLSPLQVGSANDWKSVTAALDSSFGIKLNGTLWGWGYNIAGLLGDGSVSAQYDPVQRFAGANWSMVVGGAFGHALALKTDGTLWGWADGGYGETGQDPSVFFDPTVALQIPGNDWRTITAGFRISFGIKNNGTLWAWGKNDVGQLGDGTTMNRFVPVQIGTDTDWDTVSAGWEHVVALKTNGTLFTWGSNNYGQLGNGTTAAVALPTNIPIAGCSLETAIFEVAKNKIKVSPNPATEMVSIGYAGVSSVSSISIVSVDGRIVYCSQPAVSSTFNMTLSVANLQSGVYVVLLKNAAGLVGEAKFVKQ